MFGDFEHYPIWHLNQRLFWIGECHLVQNLPAIKTNRSSSLCCSLFEGFTSWWMQYWLNFYTLGNLILTVIKPFCFTRQSMSYIIFSSTSYSAPQMHWVGRYENGQPYLNSFAGKVNSHVYAPFSWCMSFSLSSSSDKEHCITIIFSEVSQV